MQPPIAIRPMTPEDVDATYRVASHALHESPEDAERLRGRSPEDVARRKDRYRHFLTHDPGGAFVAEADGEIAGTAIAVVREGLWVLTLFAVGHGYRGTGVGRGLLDRALGYAAGCRAGMIASSQHPAALRRYAHAGFDLHPTLRAKGRVRRGAIPAGLRVRESERQGERQAGSRDLELVARVDRAVRGAAHGPDMEQMLADDTSLLVADTPAGHGYAVERRGSPAVLAATEPGVARELLWACLARAPGGEDVEVHWISGQQNWAVPVVLDAGLALSPFGPLCTRGEVGPLTPYLPSGPFL